MSVAWITGGGTGIGRALAEALCREGFSVAITGRRAPLLEETARRLAPLSGPGGVFPCPADVGDPEQVRQAARAISLRLGDVDLLVNNAGWNPYHSLQDASIGEFSKAF